jgi:hypothetical protein
MKTVSEIKNIFKTVENILEKKLIKIDKIDEGDQIRYGLYNSDLKPAGYIVITEEGYIFMNNISEITISQIEYFCDCIDYALDF